jgi:histidyl-tRNA synthetase
MIGQYVVLKGQRDLLEKLKQDEALAANESMQQGFSDMDLLFTYLEAFGASHTVSFDLSLARGMATQLRIKASFRWTLPAC